MVKCLRMQCIELLTEIEARLDFDDEMPPLDLNLIMEKIYSMLGELENALETANYDRLLQSGLQVCETAITDMLPCMLRRAFYFTFMDQERMFTCLYGLQLDFLITSSKTL